VNERLLGSATIPSNDVIVEGQNAITNAKLVAKVKVVGTESQRGWIPISRILLRYACGTGTVRQLFRLARSRAYCSFGQCLYISFLEWVWGLTGVGRESTQLLAIPTSRRSMPKVSSIRGATSAVVLQRHSITLLGSSLLSLSNRSDPFLGTLQSHSQSLTLNGCFIPRGPF